MRRDLVKRQLLKHDLSFGVVSSRLKVALGVDSDSELAALIGMSTSNFANRKRSGSIPFDLLIPLASSRNVSLDWLFRGLGTMGADGKTTDAATVLPIDSHLMHVIAQRLWEALASIAASLPGAASAADGRTMVALASLIYNRVIGESDPAKRDAELSELVPLIAMVAAASAKPGDGGL